MFARSWIFGRLVLPVVLAALTPLLHVFWPRNQELQLLPVFIPYVAAVFNLALSSAQRPRMKPRDNSKPYDRAIWAWHALEGLACLLLMVFEAVVAGCLSDAFFGVAVLCGAILYVPYVGASFIARHYLLRAYEILAMRVDAGEELIETGGQL